VVREQLLLWFLQVHPELHPVVVGFDSSVERLGGELTTNLVERCNADITASREVDLR